MRKGIFITTLLVAISILLYCSIKNPLSPPQGNISLSLKFPQQTSYNIKKTTSFIIDKIHVKIIDGSNKSRVDQDLSKSGSEFKGDFKVPIGSGYSIELGCYYSNVKIYHGSKDSVTVQTGKTTQVELELSSTLHGLEISPTSVTLGQNTTQQFAVSGVYENDQKLDLISFVNWAVNHGTAGSISSSGLFIASGSSSGSETVEAS